MWPWLAAMALLPLVLRLFLDPDGEPLLPIGRSADATWGVKVPKTLEEQEELASAYEALAKMYGVPPDPAHRQPPPAGPSDARAERAS